MKAMPSSPHGSARRRCYGILTICVFFCLSAARASLDLATEGHPNLLILQQPNATDAERHAAAELKLHLDAITGASFKIVATDDPTENSIIIGPGPLASNLFPDVELNSFGPEEFVIHSRDHHLLLAGGRPRGTIYAVDRFLQDQCGIRWWTPWATNIPHSPTFEIHDLNVRGHPAFEYRGAYWFPGLDPLWKSRNGGNNETHVIPAALGGCIQYKGFCHTFYPLVPPEKYFAEHPDWYSMINGKRMTNRAQLCLTNPKLREFMVQRVKEWLRESPDCQIVSLTQNDWDGHCECPDCKALDDAEGSHAGTMITFANYVAEKIEPEFPNVAVDTFAYQYTRKPPKTVKPRKNVIVRLCSIECNFREPLSDSSNASFAADITKWSDICQRLYVWDYVTDFRAYIHPHPNWFTLGPNVRFFQAYGVKGVFEEGAYAGHGAEMAEMRSWVLAQLLWNPQQDDRKLIHEFLDGYYGSESAKPIFEYLELLHHESKDFYLGCFLRRDPPPYLNFKTLARAEQLWQQAEQAARAENSKLQTPSSSETSSSKPQNEVENTSAQTPTLPGSSAPTPRLSDTPSDFLTRVRIAHLPVRYAFLKNWRRLRLDCWEQNSSWPLNESRKVVAEEFRAVCQGIPGKDWTQVRVLNERGDQVETFLKAFETDAVLNVQTPPPPRLQNPPPPGDLPAASLEGAVDLQDNVAGLYKRGEFADILPDLNASDHRAVRMPGSHSEWAFRISGKDIMACHPAQTCKLYVVARIEKSTTTNATSTAFVAGVYDNAKKEYPAQLKISLAEGTENYHAWLIGAFETSATRDIFVAPASNPLVKAVWVDRVYLVPER